MTVLGPHYSKIELFLIDKLNLQLNGVKLLETFDPKTVFSCHKKLLEPLLSLRWMFGLFEVWED